VDQDYIQNLDRGRKPGARKVPLQAILKWLKKIGRPSTNALAFRIQKSIYKRGIKPREFIAKAFLKMDEEIGDISDDVFEKFYKNL